MPPSLLLQVYGITAAVNHVGFNWTAYFRAVGRTRPIAVVTVVSAAIFMLAGIPLLIAFGLRGFAAGVAAQALGALVLRAYYLGRLFPGFDFLRHAARAFLPTLPAAAAVLLARWLEPGGRTLGLALAELGAYVLITVVATGWLERGPARARRSDRSRGARVGRARARRAGQCGSCRVGNRYPAVVDAAATRRPGPGRCDALRDAGHAVRVLTTLPDPSDRAAGRRRRPADVHRELRWYWRAHRFPSRTAGASASRSSAPTRPCSRAHRREFAPDVVMWWAMGGMSLSLLEQARRAGLPALAVVGDEWIAYGPGVDGWTRRWRRLPAAVGRRRRARVTGVPARLALDRAGLWSFNSDYTRVGVARRGLAAGRRHGRSPGGCAGRGCAGAPRARIGAGGCCTAGGSTPARASPPRSARCRCCPTRRRLTVHGEGDPEHLADLRRLARDLGVAGPGELQRRAPGARSPRPTPPAMRSCSRSPGASRGASCRSRRWPPGGRWSPPAPGAARPSTSMHERNCLQFAPEDADGLAAALRRLAGDAELRARLVRHGHATAERYPEEGFHDALQRRLADAVARGPLA